jgi:hypothetical protein
LTLVTPSKILDGPAVTNKRTPDGDAAELLQRADCHHAAARLASAAAARVRYDSRMSRFKPPMTRDALKALQARNPRVKGDPVSDDLYAALWEIQRLRAVVLRADQLQRTLGEPGGGVGMILGALRADLEHEPCVLEQAFLPDLGGRPRG